MKPMNWISATGLMPCAASPMAAPAISPSASGVSCTRAAPKRCCRPSVARNTPPLVPTSSPNTTTLGSWSISHACAMLMASTIVILAMTASASGALGVAPRLIALPAQIRRQLRVEIIEHAIGGLFRCGQILLDGRVDFLCAFAFELLLDGVAPQAARGEKRAQATNRLAPPGLFHLIAAAIAGRIIGGGVITEPVAERLDHAGTTARARPLDRLCDHLPHDERIVAVDLYRGDAGSDCLLRQRLGGRLLLDRHRD